MALSSASPVREELPPERQLRKQLAAAARSINWSYALFWSISSTQPGILTWTDGFYNGEVKTRKIANSTKLTADQLLMQRSEQLRELYEALLSGERDRRVSRPVASLSPEDLGDTEWYYVVCMTYAFRPGQGLPGRSFASNEHVWMCNAHLADTKAFPRALLAKGASIQTLVCIPLMGGVLELGTTDPVVEDPDLVSRATASFWELQFPACSQDPSSSPSANETGKINDIVVFEDLDHNAMETMIAGGQELGEVESLSDASLAHITKDIDEFYSLCEEMDVHPLEDTWIMDGSFEVPSSPPPAPGGVATTNDAATKSTPFDGSRATSFAAWTRPELNVQELQALFKVQANAIKQGVLRHDFSRDLQMQAEDYVGKAARLATRLGLTEEENGNSDWFTEVSSGTCVNTAYMLQHMEGVQDIGGIQPGLAAAPAWNAAWSVGYEEEVPASRVFNRLKSSLRPTSLEEVEQALDSLEIAAMSESLEGFVEASSSLHHHDDGNGSSNCSSYGGPLEVMGQECEPGSNPGSEMTPAKPSSGSGPDVQALGLDSSPGPSVAGGQELAPGPNPVDNTVPAQDNVHSYTTALPTEQVPAVDDFFITPAPPIVQQKPARAQRKKRTFDMSAGEQMTSIEKILQEYVRSIDGPMPDYIIAALATLLDLDDEEKDRMTETLLQLAGDGVADLQAEQDALMGHTA